jgi:UDP-N-acetylmuramoyl-L-alanyl-D-glutamate--2,6-diaminopimelate ligase
MPSLRTRLKQVIPASAVDRYHLVLAHLASWIYRNPSRELIVIGVTGTNGKTTTAYAIAKALEASGAKTGCTTTALLKIGDREWLNDTKMTMPGRFFLQRMLRQMVDAGCRYAVVETSSQGLVQHRQVGIHYDLAVFTNLTPEHIEAHGGFENYKKAKRLLFEHLTSLPPKKIQGQDVPRAAVINAESEHGAYYAATPGLTNIQWYGIEHGDGLRAASLELLPNGSSSEVNGYPMRLALPGRYNVENMMAALAVCQVLGVSLEAAIKRLEKIQGLPGRFERVNVGQPWTVIIDYAPEPESLKQFYTALASVPHARLIHVLGSCGGGRDVARRPILGRMAGEKADLVLVTNEDPYDDNPQEIIDQVAAGALAAGKVEGKTLFKVLDRRVAIAEAMRLAEPNDLVVLTGKGCETWMCVANDEKLPWSEREAAEMGIRSALEQRVSHSS